MTPRRVKGLALALLIVAMGIAYFAFVVRGGGSWEAVGLTLLATIASALVLTKTDWFQRPHHHTDGHHSGMHR